MVVLIVGSQIASVQLDRGHCRVAVREIETTIAIPIKCERLFPRLSLRTAVWCDVLGRVLQSIERIVAVRLNCNKASTGPNRRNRDGLAQHIAVICNGSNT